MLAPDGLHCEATHQEAACESPIANHPRIAGAVCECGQRSRTSFDQRKEVISPCTNWPCSRAWHWKWPQKNVAFSALRTRSLDAMRGNIRQRPEPFSGKEISSMKRFDINLEPSTRRARRSGPDVWVYRWRELNEQGKRQLRKKVVGTILEYRTQGRGAAGSRCLSPERQPAHRHARHDPTHDTQTCRALPLERSTDGLPRREKEVNEVGLYQQSQPPHPAALGRLCSGTHLDD